MKLNRIRYIMGLLSCIHSARALPLEEAPQQSTPREGLERTLIEHETRLSELQQETDLLAEETRQARHRYEEEQTRVNEHSRQASREEWLELSRQLDAVRQMNTDLTIKRSIIALDEQYVAELREQITLTEPTEPEKRSNLIEIQQQVNQWIDTLKNKLHQISVKNAFRTISDQIQSFCEKKPFAYIYAFLRTWKFRTLENMRVTQASINQLTNQLGQSQAVQYIFVELSYARILGREDIRPGTQAYNIFTRAKRDYEEGTHSAPEEAFTAYRQAREDYKNATLEDRLREIITNEERVMSMPPRIRSDFFMIKNQAQLLREAQKSFLDTQRMSEGFFDILGRKLTLKRFETPGQAKTLEDITA
ncbi:hypothetical protein JW872_02120 [Candidatus Babeliales bacterium]|nr:hypothetical protein [Candidatus Babeliales bacterium]